MGLQLADRWLWDFWTAVDGDRTHLFFLQAPHSLGDPDLRHAHATVGHAVSADLRTWEVLGTVLEPQPPPAYDDLATWTGSVVRGDDGRWRMYTSGISSATGGAVQGVGVSLSDDLHHWSRGPGPGIDLDPRWYRRRPGRPGAPDEHWRDPFVVGDEAGRWHCYLTAQSAGPEGRRGHGVVGHATSADLETWTVGPPLSTPSERFDQLEVMSLARVEDRWALVFSCLADEVPGAGSGEGGVWSVAVDGPGAPVDVDRAVRLTSEDLYVGRVLADPLDGAGRSVLLAFHNADATPDFPGRLIDPVPVCWRGDGAGLELAGDAVVPDRWRP